MAFFKAVTRRDGTAVGRSSPKRLEDYLKFQTDERGRVLLDEKTGKPIPRDAIVSALNADEDNFALSCREIFAQHNVNRKRTSVQYKHYVQSFPPEDNERMDRETCHRLGVELAQTVWKDFPVLVVSHFDQENNGRYHWHNHFVVGNCNVHTGQKLCTSKAMMWAQKRFVAAQADANGLTRRGLILEDGQILESQQGERITFGEYQLAKRLKKQAQGLTPEQLREYNTLTQKAELRFAIRIAANQTSTFTDFRAYLKNVYGIEVKETRGAISYLHPDRSTLGSKRGHGWIRGRSLGNSYEKEAIIHAIVESEHRTIYRGRDEQLAGGITDRERSAQSDGVESSAATGIGTAESIERLTGFYREIYPELFDESGAENQAVGRAAASDERIEQQIDGTEPGEGGESIRRGGSKQI